MSEINFKQMIEDLAKEYISGYVNTEGTGINNSSTATTTSSIISNYNDCSHRLPCGICKLTMMQCPKHYETVTINPLWTAANSLTEEK